MLFDALYMIMHVVVETAMNASVQVFLRLNGKIFTFFEKKAIFFDLSIKPADLHRDFQRGSNET